MLFAGAIALCLADEFGATSPNLLAGVRILMQVATALPFLVTIAAACVVLTRLFQRAWSSTIVWGQHTLDSLIHTAAPWVVPNLGQHRQHALAWLSDTLHDRILLDWNTTLFVLDQDTYTVSVVIKDPTTFAGTIRITSTTNTSGAIMVDLHKATQATGPFAWPHDRLYAWQRPFVRAALVQAEHRFRLTTTPSNHARLAHAARRAGLQRHPTPALLAL